ncbi:hypothetical protein [Proteiniphilum sp. X52]|uniref:hypothetical protein n=1 Tax=Proteiniphilum sp. X52 TaxID=2382159 RepID=UPI000F0A16D4|nr:hypothetical protein [Proteiniphilum sp. X52]RNC65715.1 hypothetical protein D7D25_06105 [Proteiniphilum sp. X52]
MTRKNSELRNRICNIYYTPANECSMVDIPGRDFVQVTTTWKELIYADAELKEEEPIKGEMINQELTIRILGKSREMDAELNDIISRPNIFRLAYSNGENRIVGTTENPVVLSHETSGVLSGTNLTSKRTSAEKSKILQSF